MKKEKLLESLRVGRKLRVKHPILNLYINTNVKLDNSNLVLDPFKITLPQKATKLEKLLFKLVQIYCNDVLTNNLTNDILNSKEYQKIQEGIA